MPAVLVAGLAFGDEGKGSIVDALVRYFGSDLVVRYNGGAQAAHNVVSPVGVHHTFAQFGSGSLVPGCRTYLSRYVLVNPVSMMNEAKVLQSLAYEETQDIWSRTFVDPDAVVITPYQKAVNRLEEMFRQGNNHGSTGMGIGVTRRHHLKYGDGAVFVRDLNSDKVLNEKLKFIRTVCKEDVAYIGFTRETEYTKREWGTLHSEAVLPWLLDKYHKFNNLARIGVPGKPWKDPVFEGAQGMLLDETHGFQPHTTWTDITFNNANKILDEYKWTEDRVRVGVLRTYFTRHGNGPFPSEKYQMRTVVPEPHNKDDGYAGNFRVGDFDLPLATYAIKCIGGVDALAVNHWDAPVSAFGVRLGAKLTEYYDKAELADLIQSNLAPISVYGHGPDALSKHIDFSNTEKYSAQNDYAKRALGLGKVNLSL